MKRIYVLTNPLGDYYKIGISVNTLQRCQGISRQSGIPLTVEYETILISNALKLEKLIHAKLEKYNTFG